MTVRLLQDHRGCIIVSDVPFLRPLTLPCISAIQVGPRANLLSPHDMGHILALLVVRRLQFSWIDRRKRLGYTRLVMQVKIRTFSERRRLRPQQLLVYWWSCAALSGFESKSHCSRDVIVSDMITGLLYRDFTDLEPYHFHLGPLPRLPFERGTMSFRLSRSCHAHPRIIEVLVVACTTEPQVETLDSIQASPPKPGAWSKLEALVQLVSPVAHRYIASWTQPLI